MRLKLPLNTAYVKQRPGVIPSRVGWWPANLTGANLKGANLTGANLTRATLTGANLSGVTWSNTTCPDGTNSNNNGGTCLGHL